MPSTRSASKSLGTRLVSGEVLWKWPFNIRLECLNGLSIGKDIVGLMKQVYDQSLAKDASVPDEEMLTVHFAIKQHLKSTPEGIQTCLESAFPYPNDGLIFTPDKAYVFGPDPLIFKWQSVQCDVSSHVKPYSTEYVSFKSESFAFCGIRTSNPGNIPFLPQNSCKTAAHLKRVCQPPSFV